MGTIATPPQGVVFLAARWSRKDKGLEGFLRYAVGEGIDKGDGGDFAGEVKAMAGH